MKKQEPIKPREVLYIKLGKGGEFEQECIEGGTLRLGFREATHQACLDGNWEQVQREMETITKSKGAATGAVTQIRAFYESGQDVLWVTFYKSALWWCFSKPQVKLREDKRKERPATGGWKSQSIDGKPLLMSDLSGALLMMQGFKGTICKVREKDYLISKINGEQPPRIQEAEAALRQLEEKIAAIIANLTWRDFELLIDLIFREGGWQRVSDLGKTIKALDMEMMAPITNERCGVQVKSQATLADFKSYRDDKLAGMQGFARFYFAVHSPSHDLTEHTASALLTAGEEDGSPDVTLILPQEIAHLAVRYGLSRWVIDKAR